MATVKLIRASLPASNASKGMLTENTLLGGKLDNNGSASLGGKLDSNSSTSLGGKLDNNDRLAGYWNTPQGGGTVEYHGETTKTAETIVDNNSHTISVNVNTDVMATRKYLDRNFPTNQDLEDAIAGLELFEYQVVDELPETGQTNILYLVPKVTSSGSDGYDEYLWTNDGYELVGTTDIDLSDYVTELLYNTVTHKLSISKSGVISDIHTFGSLADKDRVHGMYAGEQIGPLAVTGDISAHVRCDVVQSSVVTDIMNAELPSLTAQTSGQFATGGLQASMSLSDPEMLVFTPAATGAAVIDRGTFNAGRLPTVSKGQVEDHVPVRTDVVMQDLQVNAFEVSPAEIISE